jgi:hypothetical protein
VKYEASCRYRYFFPSSFSGIVSTFISFWSTSSRDVGIGRCDDGEVKPEYRLPPAFVGSFCLPICLFWFGWSARSSIHWIMPIIGSPFFSVGAFLLFQAVFTYLSHAYPNYVAEVFASNDLCQIIVRSRVPALCEWDVLASWGCLGEQLIGIFIPCLYPGSFCASLLRGENSAQE